jgi:hypothetical protein
MILLTLGRLGDEPVTTTDDFVLRTLATEEAREVPLLPGSSSRAAELALEFDEVSSKYSSFAFPLPLDFNE